MQICASSFFTILLGAMLKEKIAKNSNLDEL